MRQSLLIAVTLAVAMFFVVAAPPATAASAAKEFRKGIKPLLSQYCGDCHLDGMKKGGVAFDDFKSDQDALTNKELWSMVLKNVRGHIMPPPTKAHPTSEECQRLVNWIKFGVYGIDPKNLDPGRVTVRRLNRVEYHNTVRDLLGVDFDTEEEFPPDDTGYGFDDIGDVLNLSPMLLEKYLAAANTIIGECVPMVSRVRPEVNVAGGDFHEPVSAADHVDAATHNGGTKSLSYYHAARVENSFRVEHAGHYKVTLNVTTTEHYVDDQFDTNRCRMIFKIDGQEMESHEFGREGYVDFHYSFDKQWTEGDHEFAVEIQPLTQSPQLRSLALRLDGVTVSGPDDTRYWIEPRNYRRFFPRPVPAMDDKAARRAYAKELLTAFATKAFRRPPDAETVERLTDLAESRSAETNSTFEEGVANAMVAVLASPQFLFREEQAASSGPEPLIDEYSLASRLSYFLWSTMPDDELFSLAAGGRLRANLDGQVKRMLADPKASEFSRNFTGQWLQARDIEYIALDTREILSAEGKKDPQVEELHDRYRELREKQHLSADEKAEMAKLREKFEKLFRRFDGTKFDELRGNLQQEVQMYFTRVAHDDRSVLDFLDSDYDFLNQRLAKFYGLTNLGITGSEMRLVQLPTNCERGGVLTMGGVLAVTSNPTRTSPVKRGLFLLDNILGNPPPPPPPNLPALEDVKSDKGRELTLREALAIHRGKPLCASCHNRMDPLGLAFENFNALGMWRETDHGEPVESSGKLMSGESFQTPAELKRILVENHHDEFYRTLVSKLLTYAVGRGLDYQDTETVDRIVDSLDKSGGRFSVLLDGVIKSAPFQRMRPAPLLGDQANAPTKAKI